MINGTRLAWKGTKAFARASARNNVFTAQYTRGGGVRGGGTGFLDDPLIAELRSEAAYSLGYAMGARRQRKIARKTLELQEQLHAVADDEGGNLRRAAFLVLQFELRWDTKVDLSQWPELATATENVAAHVLARRQARR